MNLRRFLALFVLLALAIAPFGRMGVGEARAAPHHAATMAAHCAGQPSSSSEQGDRAIDCMIACAAMTPPASPALTPPFVPVLAATPATLPKRTGVRLEAELPPPRLV